MPGSVGINGTLKSQRAGTFYIPLIPAPYTLGAEYATQALTDGCLAPFSSGSVWPITMQYNLATTPGGWPPQVKKYNTAFLQPLTKTQVQSGDQSLTYQENSLYGGSVYYQGAFSANFSNAFGSPNGGVNTSSIGAILGATNLVNTVYIPYFNISNYSTTSFIIRSRQMQVGGTFVINYLGQRVFCQPYFQSLQNGCNFFTWSQFIPGVMRTGFNTTYINSCNSTCIGIYSDAANVMVSATFNVGGSLGWAPYITYFDTGLNPLGTYMIDFQDSTIQGLFNVSGNRVEVTYTAAGFLIKSNGIWTFEGQTMAYRYILLSFDGTKYAPVVFINQTGDNILQNVLYNPAGGGGYFGADLKIDPNGVAHFLVSQTTSILNPLKVYNSFQFNLGQLQTPNFMTIHLPSFDMPCYTPCDTPVTHN